MPAAVLGGVFGPLSYSAGDSLGALTLGTPLLISVLVLGLVWAAVLPLLMAGSTTVGQRREASRRE